MYPLYFFFYYLINIFKCICLLYLKYPMLGVEATCNPNTEKGTVRQRLKTKTEKRNDSHFLSALLQVIKTVG